MVEVGAWTFAAFRLHCLSPLHVGNGRAGMVARTHRFIPGHVFSYAFAAALGGAAGGRFEDYGQALTEVLGSARFGPAFVLDGAGRPVGPRQDEQTIEWSYLSAHNHVTLDPLSRTGVEGALFEVESLQARCLHGSEKGRLTVIGGGCWFRSPRLRDRPLSSWFALLRLGGELKTGLGRVALTEGGWQVGATTYHGIGRVVGNGLQLQRDELLPGPALDGVYGRPLEPWLGRLYDPERGFGRRLREPCFVRVDASADAPATFIPCNDEHGLGCWTAVIA